MRTRCGPVSRRAAGYVWRVARTRPSLVSEIGLLAVVVVWGVNFAVIKVPLEVAPPFTVNLLRFTVSVAVLGALHLRQARARGVSAFETFRTGGTRAVVGLGLLGIFVYQMGFIVGVDRVSAGTSALLIATAPGWTALAAHALGIERLLGVGWVAIGVSLAGVALVIAGDPETTIEAEGLGVALMLGASMAWGLYTALSRPLLERGVSPIGLTFWGIVVSFPFLIGLAAPQFGSVEWAAFDGWDVAALVFSGGLSTGLAYAIWNDSVRRVGVSRTAVFSNLVPFVAVLAGVVLQGERVSVVQIVGGVVVVAGIVLLRRRGVAPVPAAAVETVPAR